ncbi:unnamed protein product [marine sediment metagenome]|uniref:HEPN domain-containing protein n=1 Tax=marine sediment metagenome TaxID=412755 RepID=X1CD86_9ZZZZ
MKIQKELNWYKERNYYNQEWIKEAQKSIDNNDTKKAEYYLNKLRWEFYN